MRTPIGALLFALCIPAAASYGPKPEHDMVFDDLAIGHP